MNNLGDKANVHCLVIADDALASTELGRILCGAGHTLDVATIKEEAPHLIRRREPQIVFVDAHLAERKAFDIALWLRSEPALCEIPIAFFSDRKLAPEDERMARSLGVNETFMTPIQTTWFLRLVKRVLSRRERRVPLCATTDCAWRRELASSQQRRREAQMTRTSVEPVKASCMAHNDWSWATDADMRLVRFDIPGGDIAPEEALGSTWLELYANQFENPAKWEWFIEVQKTRRSFDHFEHQWILVTGATVALRISGTPEFGDDAEFQGYAGTACRVHVRRNDAARGEAQKVNADAIDRHEGVMDAHDLYQASLKLANLRSEIA